MSEFIKLELDVDSCLGMEKCGSCIQVCPVTIFAPDDYYPRIVLDNEDECVLCDLCVYACRVNAITIHRLYEK